MFSECFVISLMLLEFNRGDFPTIEPTRGALDDGNISVTVATISESDDVTELMPVMNETVQMVLTADNITMGYVQMEDNTTRNNSIPHNEMPSDLNATDIVSEGVNTTDMSYWKWLVYQNRTNFLQGTRLTSDEEDEVKVEDFTTEFNISEKAEELEATQTWRYIQPYTEGTTHENTQDTTTVFDDSQYYFYSDDEDLEADDYDDINDTEPDDYDDWGFYEEGDGKDEGHSYAGNENIQWQSIEDLDKNSELRSRVPESMYPSHAIQLPFKSVGGVKVSHVGQRVEVHWPIHLANHDSNISIIVLYSWLAVVAVIVLCSFIIVKHRQKLTSLVRTGGRRRQRTEDEDHNLLLHQHV